MKLWALLWTMLMTLLASVHLLAAAPYDEVLCPPCCRNTDGERCNHICICG